MTMDARDLPTLNRCVNLLMTQLAEKQIELRRWEECYATDNGNRVAALREGIASLEDRLARAERLQDEVLCARATP
jgi:hypothetical protein